MFGRLFKKISNDLTLLPHKGLFVTLFLFLSLFVTVELAKNPIFRLTKADELHLPEGYTALEYLQALGQADTNNDGVINLFDYAVLLEQDYGAEGAFITSDVNYDQRANAIDNSFMLNNFYTDVNEEREKVFASEQYVQEVNKEIALRNEDALPITHADDSVLTITSEEGGSEPEYGRNIIPQVLGTVSTYTGAATYSLDFQLPKGPGGLSPSLGLSYSSASIDDARNNGTHGGKPFYTQAETYMPFQFGYGFSLSGIGSIVRDTKDEKEVYKLKGNLYHRYILNLPGGISAELKYNPTTGRWVSIPQSFLKIEHRSPGKIQLGALSYLDPWDWEVTTKDGTTYYFGEENIETKLNTDARIIGSEDIRDAEGNLTGTKNGNLYVEFDKGHLCEGESEQDPCRSREKNGKVLIVTKWLLRKVETADGREISYAYDTQQRYLEKPWSDTSIAFVTATSYPKEISWNDGKHRVLLTQEDRPDKAKNGFMNSRVKEVVVQTKKQEDNQYHLVRKYVLNYFDQNEKTKEFLGVKAGEEAEGINNEFKASFLTSVQEIGTDGVTALPPTSFRYLQYAAPPQGYHGNEIYLSTINNGYGGETRFSYQLFGIAGLGPRLNGGGGKNLRARVIQKEVADLVSGKASKERYEYGDARMFSENFRKAPVGEGGSADEFLGHSSVELKQYDFDGTLLAHTDTFFNQANFGNGCFEPHPAKGQPYRQVIYRGDSRDVAQETNIVFRYRFDGMDGLNPSDGCKNERRSQPLFLYTYDTTSIQREPAKDFVPLAFKDKVKGAGKSELRTLQRVLAHDEYGNQTLSVNYGEVDQDGVDVDKTDNRYGYSYYLTSGEKWIKSLASLTYASNVENCGPENLTCQWGRTKSYYDNFDKNYWELSAEEMQPKYGLLTQKETWIDDSHVTVEGYEYDDLSGDKNDTDLRKGNITRTYAPKTNIKKVADPKNDVVLMSEKTYDPYYHTLLTEEKNALGFKKILQDYNFLLQLPTTIKTQIQDAPEAYAVSRMEFDALGRMIAQFAPDPENPGSTMDTASSRTHFFEQGNNGLVVRSAQLTSQTQDGQKHFQVSDKFYDGLGQVRQAQMLRTSVDGVDVRKVTNNEYHADGSTSKTFELQTTTPVTIDVNNIAAVQPQFVADIPQVVSSEVQFDALRRPLSSTRIETESGQKFTSTTEYSILGTKNTDPNGVEKIAIADVWGRGKYAFTQDRTKQKILMTINEYAKPLLEQATKTTIMDATGTKTESMFDYDKSGRLIFSQDPSLGQYRFEYDVYGNKILEISQPREDVGYEYDVMGRLIKKKYYSLSDGELYNKMLNTEVTYVYDAGAFALGKLTKVHHLTGTKEFIYDGGQRLIKTRISTFSNAKDFATSYNQLSQEIASEFPDGTRLNKEYDREGRVAKMMVDGKDVFKGASYDKFGNQRIAQAEFKGTEYTNTNVFDTLGRLKILGVSKKAAVFGSGVVDFDLIKQSISYNKFSEIDTLEEAIPGRTTLFDYGYDGFSQLTSVKSPVYNTEYEYDLFGRMLKKNEKDSVVMKYSATYPFFAPKTVEITGEEQAELVPEVSITPPGPEASPSPIPTGGPTKSLPLVSPSVSPTSGPIEQTLGVTTRSYDIGYTNEGGMRNDDNNCYRYNREGELIFLGLKNNKKGTCTDENFKKVYMFYYDEGGAMNLQEEYEPTNLQKPTKQIYLFGQYEEEVTQ